MAKKIYRGKNVEDGEWVTGSLTQFNSGECFISNQNPKPEDSYAFTYEVDPLTVGVLIYDNCILKIYKGDILVSHPIDVDGEMKQSIYPVVWDEKNLQWAVDVSYSKNKSSLEPLSFWVEEGFEQALNAWDHSDKIQSIEETYLTNPNKTEKG